MINTESRKGKLENSRYSVSSGLENNHRIANIKVGTSIARDKKDKRRKDEQEKKKKTERHLQDEEHR